MNELLEFAAASQPFAPGEESGDSCLVRVLPGAALVALVDGVGHGAPAVEAARRAIAQLEDAVGEHPTTVVQRCHEHLRETRGAVMSLAWFDGASHTMTWLGVGNIDGVLLRCGIQSQPRLEHLLLRNGVLGRQVPAFRASRLPVTPGDTLAFATDGVRPAFTRALSCEESPEPLAQRIIAEHAIAGDDAMVVVARYRGAPHD